MEPCRIVPSGARGVKEIRAGPAKVGAGEKNGGTYTIEEIFRWLGVFLDRFFRRSQFKRSALPNAPKVGSGGSLLPRGDWRAPSDSGAAPWLADLDRARAWMRRSLPVHRRASRRNV